jgi:hypothetical protein
MELNRRNESSRIVVASVDFFLQFLIFTSPSKALKIQTSEEVLDTQLKECGVKLS